MAARPLSPRPWRRAGVPAAVLLLSLTACTGDTTLDADRTSGTVSPAASGSASPTSTAPSASAGTSSSAPGTTETTARAVYYLMDTGRTGPRLYREFHRRPATPAVVADAVTAMLEEPADDPDYRSLWADGTRLLGARVDGTTAVVDLSGEARTSGGGSAFEAATLQQLVHTVTAAAPEVRSVRLLVEGEEVPTLWGAVDTTQPLTRAPAAEVLGAVWILEPAEGGTVTSGGSFGGEATVFEATVNWEWRQGDRVVAKGFSTADEGAPGRGSWEAPVEVPPGDYELRAFESSAEDGRPLFVDTKAVTVTG